MASFVRYRPCEEADLGSLELNEARLFEKWKKYLDMQKNVLGIPYKLVNLKLQELNNSVSLP